MAPNRRPVLPKASNKSTKRAPIDFTNSESLHASRTEFTSEDWMDEGVRQEEQGERYQFGDKSERHFTNSLLCYEASNRKDPKNHDSNFNCSRVLYLLATEFDPAPQNISRLAQSIELYRSTDGIDGEFNLEFNLAQSLNSLGSLLEEGAHLFKNGATQVPTLPDSITIWKEASERFQSLESRQMVQMQRDGLGPNSNELRAGEDMMEIESEITMMITPSMIIETILALLSNDLSLLNSSANSSPPSQSFFVEALGRIHLLQQFITTPDPKQELEVDLITLSIAATFPAIPPAPSDLSPRYESLINKYGQDVELLSTYADYLLEGEEETEKALSLYEMSFKILSDPFKKQATIPGHIKPSILSANILSRASIHLFRFRKEGNRIELEKAMDLIKTAIKCTEFGYKLERLADGEWKMIKIDPGRKDFRTVKAVKEGLLALLRCSVLGDPVGIISLLGLLENLAGNSKEFISIFLEEIKNDFIWQDHELSLWQQLL